jgi:hypothetical protein
LNGTSVSLKNIILTKQENNEPTRLDEVDNVNARPCTQCTQTETEPPAILKKNSIKTRLLNKIFSRKNLQSKKLIDIQQSYRFHRPYFTYWVTFVQILVCIVSLIVYGYAPMTSTQSNNASIFEQQRSDLTMNPWFGPYPADLIRLGAKYTPCIRRHDEVRNRYEKQARLEITSGFNMVSNAIENDSEYRLSCCMWTNTGNLYEEIDWKCSKRR